MPNIFDYTDYRAYLADYYAEQKAEKSWYSYRVLSQKIGFRSRDFIYRVIRGEKCLSQASIAKVSKGLSHSPEESKWFESLVRFNQAKTAEEKAFYLEHLRGPRTVAGKKARIRKIADHELALFAEWRHVAVRAILDMVPFKDDYTWLSRQLTPPITVHQAKQSVNHLKKLGMIEQGDDEIWQVTDKVISTDDEVQNVFLARFYQSCLRLGSEALQNQHRDKRNVAGVTLGISRKRYPEVVKAVARFRRELEELAEKDNDADIVYQFQSLLFPMSRQIRSSDEENAE